MTTFTVCGLAVDQDPPERWTALAYEWGTDDAVADPYGAVALSAEKTVGAASDNGQMLCIGLAVAAVHPQPTKDEGPLEEATMTPPLTEGEVARERDLHLDTPPQAWTVCGVDRRTWRALSFHVTAPTWLLAYVAALDMATAAGQELLYARTHAGHVPRLGYLWADPLAESQAGMDLYARDNWQVT